MPAGSTWLNRDKARPFALATASAPGALGTLLYGSTQQTEKVHGAAAVEVAPIHTGLNRNGLLRRTFFYPGALIPLTHERLPPHAGFLGRSLPELRMALRTALGIGRGSCADSRAPAGSCRGRVVAIRAAMARHLGAPFAVVLTEPGYSASRSYQIILPVFSEFSRTPGPYDLVLSAGDWPGVLPAPAGRVLLPIPLVQSVWHAGHILRETRYVVDDGTLAEIDRRLCDYFSLPPVDGG